VELHSFIKKLLLSNYIFVDNISEKVKLTSRKLDAGDKSGLLLLVEFYIKKDDLFIPLCRFDITLTGNKDIDMQASTYLAEALSGSLQKTTTINWTKTLALGKKLRWEDISKFNTQRMDLPVLYNPPAKGIYRTLKISKTTRCWKKTLL
jgi:hypothetical protein